MDFFYMDSFLSCRFQKVSKNGEVKSDKMLGLDDVFNDFGCFFSKATSDLKEKSPTKKLDHQKIRLKPKKDGFGFYYQRIFAMIQRFFPPPFF